MSPVPDPQALVVDALSLPWQDLWAYTFLPHHCLTKVLTKLRQSNSQFLLMALPRLSQPWFLDLLDPSIDHPWRLPVTKTLLRQPRSNRIHLDLGRLQLHASTLSEDHSVRPDSPGKKGCSPSSHLHQVHL